MIEQRRKKFIDFLCSHALVASKCWNVHETLKIHIFTMIKSDSMEASWMGFLHEYAMKFLWKYFCVWNGNVSIYDQRWIFHGYYVKLAWTHFIHKKPVVMVDSHRPGHKCMVTIIYRKLHKPTLSLLLYPSTYITLLFSLTLPRSTSYTLHK